MDMQWRGGYLEKEARVFMGEVAENGVVYAQNILAPP